MVCAGTDLEGVFTNTAKRLKWFVVAVTERAVVAADVGRDIQDFVVVS